MMGEDDLSGLGRVFGSFAAEEYHNTKIVFGCNRWFLFNSLLK
jgi:hypothetical protein